jgi:hypothetical protein
VVTVEASAVAVAATVEAAALVFEVSEVFADCLLHHLHIVQIVAADCLLHHHHIGLAAGYFAAVAAAALNSHFPLRLPELAAASLSPLLSSRPLLLSLSSPSGRPIRGRRSSCRERRRGKVWLFFGEAHLRCRQVFLASAAAAVVAAAAAAVVGCTRCSATVTVAARSSQ